MLSCESVILKINKLKKICIKIYQTQINIDEVDIERRWRVQEKLKLVNILRNVI